MPLSPDALLGAWTLAEWRVQTERSGRTDWPFGRDATGLIVYAANGWMSATLSQRARSPLSAPSARQADEPSRARALAEYLAYAGRWTVDGETVVHSIELALNPALLGTRQVRTVSWDDGDLILGATETEGKARRTHRLRWRRG